jgi:hypothetical protein
MKRFTSLALAAAACALSAGPACAAGFSGPFAPAHWTTTISGPAFGSMVDTSAAPDSITLTGGDDLSMAGCPDGTVSGFFGGCEIDFTTAVVGQVSFHWAYATADITPQYDEFGVIVDGVRTELVANGGDLTQGGNFSAAVHTSFGWYINCTDCTGGAATATLSNLAAVPESSTAVLLPLGLAALAFMRRRVRG